MRCLFKHAQRCFKADKNDASELVLGPFVVIDHCENSTDRLSTFHNTLAIWRAHWSAVFHDVPFVASSVVSSVSRLTEVFRRESLYVQGISPFPLTHFNIADEPILQDCVHSETFFLLIQSHTIEFNTCLNF
ncbi:hypothetical protein BDF14DRAFT_1792968, partial [Spinellus fusiger]